MNTTRLEQNVSTYRELEWIENWCRTVDHILNGWAKGECVNIRDLVGCGRCSLWNVSPINGWNCFRKCHVLSLPLHARNEKFHYITVLFANKWFLYYQQRLKSRFSKHMQNSLRCQNKWLLKCSLQRLIVYLNFLESMVSHFLYFVGRLKAAQSVAQTW